MPKTDWKARFEEFHSDNPHIYDLFKQFAQQVIRRGYKRFSSIAIFDRIRWELNVERHAPGDSFKINQNYTPYYARLWMKDHPDHDGFFETRILHSDRGRDEREIIL